MGRTVGDVALLDSVITGQPVPQPVSLKGQRFGIPRALFWEDLDSELAEIAESTLVRLKSAGAVLVDVNLGSLRELTSGMRPITGYEFPLDLTAYLAAAGNSSTVHEVIRQVASRDVARILAEPGPSKDTYDAAVNVFRPRLQKIYADIFSQHMLAAIVFPTTPLPARPIRDNGDTGQDTVELNGQQVPTFTTYVRNTGPGSLAGIPGLSVPIGITRAGLPVGLEFDGRVNSDRALLGLGMSVENEVGVLPSPKL